MEVKKAQEVDVVTYNFSLCKLCVSCLHVPRKRCISKERAEFGASETKLAHTKQYEICKSCSSMSIHERHQLTSVNSEKSINSHTKEQAAASLSLPFSQRNIILTSSLSEFYTKKFLIAQHQEHATKWFTSRIYYWDSGLGLIELTVTTTVHFQNRVSPLDLNRINKIKTY